MDDSLEIQVPERDNGWSLKAQRVGLKRSDSRYLVYVDIPAQSIGVTPEEPPPDPGPTPPVLKSFDDSAFTYTGIWNTALYAGAYQGGDHYTSSAGATASFQFTGTEIHLYGTKDAHHGSGTVKVDGVSATVSWVAASRQEQVEVFAKTGLPAGTHTVTVTVSGPGVVAVDRVDVDGDVSGAPPPDPGPDPGPGPGPVGPLQAIKVQGNQLVRADGTRFVPRGTNFYGVKAYPAGGPADGQMGPVNSWHQSKAPQIAALCAAEGMNFCRLLCAIDDSIRPGIKTIADANAAAGIYTMISGFSGVGFDTAGGTRAGQWLTATWVGLGRPAHVVINLFNEPHGISDAQWQAFTAAGIAACRAGGYTGPVFCDGNGWAHVNNVPQLVAIGDPQTVLCCHAYAYDGGCQGPGYATRMVNAWKADNRRPVMTGEWGPFNEGRFGGSNCSFNAAVSEFCREMRAQVVAAIGAGTMCGNLSWMLTWDGNSQLSGAQGGDWWDIVSGAETPVWNPWGDVARGSWADCAAIAP